MEVPTVDLVQGNMASYTSEDNISGGFSNEDNYMYFGRTVGGSNFYKGFMGNVVITSRSQFRIQASQQQPKAATQAAEELFTTITKHKQLVVQL